MVGQSQDIVASLVIGLHTMNEYILQVGAKILAI